MPTYIVDRQPRADGAHEVHNVELLRCPRLPPVERQTPVGYHTSGHPALAKARKEFATAVACAACCPECQVPAAVGKHAVAETTAARRARAGGR